MKKLLAFLSIVILCSCNTESSQATNTLQKEVPSSTKAEVATPSDTLTKSNPSNTNNQSETDFYTTVLLYNSQLSVDVPAAFKKMTLEEIKVKYPNSKNTPQAGYCSERLAQSLVFWQTGYPVAEGNLHRVLPQFDAQFRSTNPENYRSKIQSINGTDWIVAKFISQAPDAKICNTMFATIIDGKLILGSFNYGTKYKVEWESREDEILNSLRVIPKG